MASVAAYPPSEYAVPYTVAAAQKTAVRKAKKGKKTKFKKRRKLKHYLLKST